MNYSDLIQALDTLIRSGQGLKARTQILKINPSKIPRESKAQVASLARRVGLDHWCVRILYPVMHPPKGAPSNATELEKAEYAAGLIKLGSIREGMSLLEKLDEKANPQIHMFRGLGCIAEWEYKSAIPHFEAGSTAQRLTDYQRLVCRVNLSACLVHERRYKEATELLTQLLLETASSHPVLRGNLLMYFAELKVETSDLKGARKFIDEADELLGNVPSIDSLYVGKWKAIVDLIETKDGSKAAEHLEKIKQAAYEKQHWETIRDCDYYKGMHLQDEKTLLHLYFGTPFSQYRTRILESCKDLALPKNYVWELDNSKQGPPFAFLGGEPLTNGEKLKVGQSKHRLLMALVSDYYRPQTIATLFGAVFSDEYYNPLTSPKRINLLILRVRRWLKSSRIPMTIEENSSNFRLKATAPCRLAIPERSRDAADYALLALHKHFPESFSISQAMKVLNTSQNSALRLLTKAMDRGQINRQGKKRGARYFFTHTPQAQLKAA